MKDPKDAFLHSKRRHADLLIHGGTVLTPNGAEIIDIACSAGRIIAG
ncbi:dihydroorotase [Nitrosomonas marina]|uniref:Dihydroorotase n=1 Tax=Nitrosomonas marina TaxID=917 RepID=A0A1H8DB68_9PROT|nr:dihydroorotase [Nitrosomonas marina]